MCRVAVTPTYLEVSTCLTRPDFSLIIPSALWAAYLPQPEMSLLEMTASC